MVSFPWDILASFPAWQTFYHCSGEPEALAAHLGRFTFPLTPAVAHVYVLQYVAENFATMLVSRDLVEELTSYSMRRRKCYFPPESLGVGNTTGYCGNKQ